MCKPVEGPDGTIINGERVDSSKGGQQECALATYFCMSPLQRCMRVVQKKHPKVRIINFADDAYTNAKPRHLYTCIATMELDIKQGDDLHNLLACDPTVEHTKTK